MGTPHPTQPCSIYDALAAHQTTDDWDLREMMADLRVWSDRMIFEFKLEIPTVSLCIDWLPASHNGHFRGGHNGFGLQREIALNRRSLSTRPYWQVLGTLLHEHLHAWQELHGKPGKHNYHNVEFQRRAARYGLLIDAAGHTQYAPESPFLEFLARYGVTVPVVPQPDVRLRGSSKLKLWVCACPTRVRVAVPDFRARCLRCNCDFVLTDR